jgi:hypothetical protein
MDGSFILGVVLTILAGISLAVQSGVNATLGSSTGSKPFASAFSFAVGMAVCLIYLLIDTTTLKHQLPSAAGVACESQLLQRAQQAAVAMHVCQRVRPRSFGIGLATVRTAMLLPSYIASWSFVQYCGSHISTWLVYTMSG